jgi:hypothetical protein
MAGTNLIQHTRKYASAPAVLGGLKGTVHRCMEGARRHDLVVINRDATKTITVKPQESADNSSWTDLDAAAVTPDSIVLVPGGRAAISFQHKKAFHRISASGGPGDLEIQYMSQNFTPVEGLD